MIRNTCIIIVATMVLSSCASVKYNGAKLHENRADYPRVGQTSTAYVGDNILINGTIFEEDVLNVYDTVDGMLYRIPSNKYYQVGFSEKFDFYTDQGVVAKALSDPTQALAVRKEDRSELCVVSIYDGLSCYKSRYKIERQMSSRGDGFQQALIYSGRIDDKINVSYREFSNNRARPAFSNEVEYDISKSKEIGYKKALIEIIDADNSSITYRVLRNFEGKNH